MDTRYDDEEVKVTFVRTTTYTITTTPGAIKESLGVAWDEDDLEGNADADATDYAMALLEGGETFAREQFLMTLAEGSGDLDDEEISVEEINFV